MLRPQTRGFAADALREKENYIEDLRLCRGSSSYKSPSTKRGTPASQAPQEFQTSIFFFLQLFYYHQLPKLGVLLYGFPQFRQKYNCEKIAVHLQKFRCVREPLRFARGFLFALGEDECSTSAAGICERSEPMERTCPRQRLIKSGRAAIPILTIIGFLSFLHIGSDGGACGSKGQFLKMYF